MDGAAWIEWREEREAGKWEVGKIVRRELFIRFPHPRFRCIMLYVFWKASCVLYCCCHCQCCWLVGWLASLSALAVVESWKRLFPVLFFSYACKKYRKPRWCLCACACSLGRAHSLRRPAMTAWAVISASLPKLVGRKLLCVPSSYYALQTLWKVCFWGTSTTHWWSRLELQENRRGGIKNNFQPASITNDFQRTFPVAFGADVRKVDSA